MTGSSVNVEGIGTLVRDIRRADKALARDLVGELKTAAEPVLEHVQARSARYGARTVAGEKIANRGSTILVRQSITGKRIRPKFGSILMRYAFAPAVEAEQARVEANVEKWLDQLFVETNL